VQLSCKRASLHSALAGQLDSAVNSHFDCFTSPTVPAALLGPCVVLYAALHCSSKPSAAGEQQREAALAAAALPAAKRLKTSGQVLIAGCCRGCKASVSPVRDVACYCEALCGSGYGSVAGFVCYYAVTGTIMVQWVASRACWPSLPQKGCLQVVQLLSACQLCCFNGAAGTFLHTHLQCCLRSACVAAGLLKLLV
jgi:hypothetical protein